MGLLGVQLLSLLLLASAQEKITVKKLVKQEDLQAEYCRIETSGSSGGGECAIPSNITAIDVISLPQSMAEQIAGHVQDAHKKNYYFHLSKQDLFHGHLLAGGPKTVYTSPEDYFLDVRLILYHSQEYLNTWEDIEGHDPFVPHKQQRSFVGWFDERKDVTPAIDLIDRSLYPPPYTLNTLRMYKTNGTIYLPELNQSVQESLHSLDGSHVDFYMVSGDKREKRCEIFQQIYILEQSDGRFLSADGTRFDITLHCRYMRD